MNDITLKGRLVNAPEISFFNGDKVACSFTVAVNRSHKAENKPEADFFDCKAFGKLAEFVDKYFKKGQEILVKGEMHRRSFKDKEGNTRYIWECIVFRVEFCGSKNQQTPANETTDSLGFTIANEILSASVLPF